MIEVEDSGKGIALEKQEGMFEMFKQQYNFSEYENTGVGLGLTYCKMVIQQMEGQIQCHS